MGSGFDHHACMSSISDATRSWVQAWHKCQHPCWAWTPVDHLRGVWSSGLVVRRLRRDAPRSVCDWLKQFISEWRIRGQQCGVPTTTRGDALPKFSMYLQGRAVGLAKILDSPNTTRRRTLPKFSICLLPRPAELRRISWCTYYHTPPDCAEILEPTTTRHRTSSKVLIHQLPSAVGQWVRCAPVTFLGCGSR